MDNLKQSYEGSNTNDFDTDLNSKKENLIKLRAEYLAAQELVQEKQRKLESLSPQYNKLNNNIFELTEYRDELNAAIRRQRKEKEQAEVQLTYAKSKLTKYENAVIEARKNVGKAKRDAKPFFNLWQSAQTELLNTEKMLAVAFENLKAAEQEYLLVGGKLSPEDKLTQAPQAMSTDSHTNPWLSGTFYLFVLVIIIGIIIYLNYLSIPWYITITGFSLALLGLLIISALQLRNDKNLSEENFTKLMLEVIKKLPFMKKD